MVERPTQRIHAEYIINFSDIRREDGAIVGGKNASLGEMIHELTRQGVRVPGGFAITAKAYRDFVDENGIAPAIQAELDKFDRDPTILTEIGPAIRALILNGDLSDELKGAIRAAYHEMARSAGEPASVAVRSSATAEDLPEASFAGQLETFLNIEGDDALLDACKRCFASLFTDRAISYRRSHGFTQSDMAISVGVQRMVRSGKASSGVMFSIDTESGFPHVVLINGAWGLGETVVQGTVDPDEFEIFKPLLDKDNLHPVIFKRRGAKAKKLLYADDPSSPTRLVETTGFERDSFVLTDEEILRLARWAALIEAHYGQPMDMEWAKDGETNELFIVQARPETVQSRRQGALLKRYTLKQQGKKLIEGLAIGDAIASGKARLVDSAENIGAFEPGSVLVTEMTDPDWAPIMKKAAAIVTDHGGRTSHAAIVSRELGLPAVIGTGSGTKKVKDGETVTVSCAEGATGAVYDGALAFVAEEIDLSDVPETRTQVMLNLANPSAAFRWWRLPADGVGLARIEFIISNLIKVHPMALVHFDKLKDTAARRKIDILTRGYDQKTEYFIDKLAQGVARIAAGFYPKPVIVRLSDFKTNEYAGLLGGAEFEPREDNPMLGWRGASRYYDARYRAGFALECAAMARVRNEIGLTNVKLMVPFCRTPEEADNVLKEMAKNGLKRGDNGLEIFVMAEIPSNIILADDFAKRFDGFSIGSNDLTQLTLGIDRDSEILKSLFDERNDAVTSSISRLLAYARKSAMPVGICGEAPSNYPEYAEFLVENGVDSISVSPDSFLTVKKNVAKAEGVLSNGQE